MQQAAEAEQERAETAPCGLYLVLPDNWMEPEFLRNLRDLFRAINASSYEKNNHVIELRARDEAYGGEEMEKIMAMAALTKAQGVNFIIGGDIGLAIKCEADGVIVDTVDAVRAAREKMGDDPIVGMRCGTSRMRAEEALHAGADYVAFSDAAKGFVDPAIIRWWNVKTDEHPCLVEGALSNDNCGFYVEAGAYFIEGSRYVWEHPKGVMQGVVNMLYAFDLATYGEEGMKESVQ
ncbi:MAG: thiamine phosphate synthase [Micavibrio sp.]